jgi:hypothetical protein
MPPQAAAPPPPSADTRMAWPAPPPTGSGDPQLSDTMERMLRPQGLFQNPQPKPFDWQQPWAAPAIGGGAGAAPPPNGGQYPPGNGQYPPPQYGQGQYPPGPYGQGQYGAGPQFGPDGSPLNDGKPPRKLGGVTLPSGPLVPAIVVAVLVVIVVTAIILSTMGSPASNTASSGSGANAGAGTQSAGSSSGGSASSAAERQAAVKLSGLLSQSGTDRSDVNAAYENVQACGKDLASDARVFNRSAANRRALLAQLNQLPGRSALSAAMVADLTSAWQASATVDSDLAKWATAAAGHCRHGDSKNSSLVASGQFDSQATDNKQAFATLWNRLAHRDGLSTFTVDQL